METYMVKKNQYSDVVRPNVWLTQTEDLAMDNYINTLKQSKKQRIFKGEFIKECINYCIKNKIDPWGD